MPVVALIPDGNGSHMKHRRITLLPAAATFLLLALTACGPETPSSSTGSPSPSAKSSPKPTAGIAELEAGVFADDCTSCHNTASPEGHLDLSPGHACASLVNHDSCLFNGRTLVVPGDSRNSFLVRKVDGTDLGGTPDSACDGGENHSSSRMPLAGSPLDADEVSAIAAWIDAGASCAAGPAATPTATPSATGTLSLVEVLYDVTGSDDGLEWVMLQNTSTAPVDLSKWSLGAGTSSWTYTVAQLSGSVAPGACFVVGGPSSTVANGSPVLSQPFHFAPNLPNGSASYAGVALFNTAAESLAASSLPADAVVFGSGNTTLKGPDGSIRASDSAGAAPGRSLRKISSTSWSAQSPTPSICPVL